MCRDLGQMRPYGLTTLLEGVFAFLGVYDTSFLFSPRVFKSSHTTVPRPLLNYFAYYHVGLISTVTIANGIAHGITDDWQRQKVR